MAGSTARGATAAEAAINQRDSAKPHGADPAMRCCKQAAQPPIDFTELSAFAKQRRIVMRQRYLLVGIAC